MKQQLLLLLTSMGIGEAGPGIGTSKLRVHQ
jgi:hypothetical protein